MPTRRLTRVIDLADLGRFQENGFGLWKKLGPGPYYISTLFPDSNPKTDSFSMTWLTLGDSRLSKSLAF